VKEHGRAEVVDGDAMLPASAQFAPILEWSPAKSVMFARWVTQADSAQARTFAGLPQSAYQCEIGEKVSGII